MFPDFDIKGFYTLDAALVACARVPVPSLADAPPDCQQRGGPEPRGVVGVHTAALVAHVAAVSRSMLLADRFFPGAAAPPWSLDLLLHLEYSLLDLLLHLRYSL